MNHFAAPTGGRIIRPRGFSRRDCLKAFGAGALSLAALRGGFAAEPSSKRFRFAVLADTHIIDSLYAGPEGNDLDTATIYRTTERLQTVRDAVCGVKPAIERAFICGDFFHNYPSTDYEFYFQNQTRLDNARALIDSFPVPVHPAFGNHDYDIRRVPRETSHKLFRAKFGVEPYYSVEHKGCKFVILSNFLGETCRVGSPGFDREKGSFGEEQLNWLEAQLGERRPTFIFLHYPLSIVQGVEKADYGIYPLLKKYRGNIQRVVAGHWHRWHDFGDQFGPQHYVIASTRYDVDAYMLVEMDMETGTHTALNLEAWEWDTNYSKPWRPKG